MAEQQRWAGLATRSELKTANQLGVIMENSGVATSAHRRPDLDILDAYYEGRQYDKKSDWTQAQAADGNYIPVRERKPLLQMNFARMMTARITSKLVGKRTFPMLKIEGDPDTEQYLKLIINSSMLTSKILEPCRRMLAAGSCFVRFSIVEGQFKITHYLSKHCFPEFDNAGNLEKLTVKYVYEDFEDLDEKKKPKKKWFKMDLGKASDILYDNPAWEKTQNDPEFKVVATANHNLGFVQGEWLKTADMNNNKADGPSMIEDILCFIDELNYSLSQSSQAIQYNQDPQLTIKNMDEDEIQTLIRTATKARDLGRDGEANFLEAGMSGVEAAGNFRETVKQNVQDLARVVLLDPEKIVGNAQSAKAMEVLHGPMVELIEELRPRMEKAIKDLVLKMAIANLILSNRGAERVPVVIPDGYQPLSLNVVAQWPAIFAPTMEDLRAKVGVAAQAAGANLISRETMTKWLAKDFDIEDIEAEIDKIANQPVINPFGAF